MNKHVNPAYDEQNELISQMDRLVSGDLSELERSKLLKSARENSALWEKMALAFLESQAWEESLSKFDELHGTHTQLPPGTAKNAYSSTAPETSKTTLSFSWSQVISIAAGMLLSFFVGWTIRAETASNSRTENLMSDSTEVRTIPDTGWVWATVERAPFDVPLRGARMQIAVRLVDGKPVETTASSIQISDYQKQVLNRRGISISKDYRFVTAVLPDGTDVAVPYENLTTKPSKRVID